MTIRCDRPGIAQELWRALEGRQLRLVLGAGASIDAKLPDWLDLARRVAANMRGRKTATKCSVDPTWAIECLRGRAKEREYRLALRRSLYGEDFALAPETWPFFAVRYLAAIAAQVAFGSRDAQFHAISYNLDCLLELSVQRLGLEAVALVPVVGEAVPYRAFSFLPDRRVSRDMPVVRVLHPHGLVPLDEAYYADEDGLLAMPLTMSSQDYEIRGGVADIWQNSLQIGAFSQTRCLFYGFSFVDPSVRKLLRLAAQMRAIQAGAVLGAGHLAMLPMMPPESVPSDLEVEARLADLGLTHLFWSASDFRDQVSVLDELCKHCMWGDLSYALSCR